MAQLVAHLVWDQGVARSNRVAPTRLVKLQKTIGSIIRLLLALQIVITTTASAQHEIIHLEKKAKTECSGSEHSSHESSDHHSENCIFCAHGSAISESSTSLSVIIILPVTESEVGSPSFYFSHISKALPSLRGPPSLS